jgi:hypothetical protein
VTKLGTELPPVTIKVGDGVPPGAVGDGVPPGVGDGVPLGVGNRVADGLVGIGVAPLLEVPPLEAPLLEVPLLEVPLLEVIRVSSLAMAVTKMKAIVRSRKIMLMQVLVVYEAWSSELSLDATSRKVSIGNTSWYYQPISTATTTGMNFTRLVYDSYL